MFDHEKVDKEITAIPDHHQLQELARQVRIDILHRAQERLVVGRASQQAGQQPPRPGQLSRQGVSLGEKRWAEIRKSHEEDIRQILIGKQREGAAIRQALGDMLASAHDRIGGRDRISDQIVVTRGDVVACIVDEARSRQADLIVMGYHAKGRLEEAVAGSVSRSVLRKTDVPVLLVKLPTDG